MAGFSYRVREESDSVMWTYEDKQPLTHICICYANMEGKILKSCIFLDCKRKLD